MDLYEIYKNNKLPEIWQKKTKEFVKPGKSEKEKELENNRVEIEKLQKLQKKI